jgi:type VI secretion system protein ImpM
MSGTLVVSESTSLTAGWYGKLPTLGDFASRRLPHHFISAWDAWLQTAISASRDQLGENWLNVYLTSPMWRFALMQGACTPEAWAGVMLPSVDKVGRYFPLTVAMQLDPRTAVFSAETWYGALEEIAFSTLDVERSVEDLERSLAELTAPAASLEQPAAQSLATWWHGDSVRTSSIEIVVTGSLASVAAQTAQQVWAVAGYGKSMWWATTAQTGATRAHCFVGLPPATEFVSLMHGACSSN